MKRSQVFAYIIFGLLVVSIFSLTKAIQHTKSSTIYSINEYRPLDKFSVKDTTKRLRHHVNYLFFLSKKKSGILNELSFGRVNLLKSGDQPFEKILVDKTLSFKHELVEKCAKEINRDGKLAPFFLTWKHFEKSKISHRHLFLKDFSVLLLVVYTQVLIRVSDKHGRAPSFPNMVNLYQSVSELPILQLLDLLDEFLTQFEVIMEEYNIINSSWSQWKKTLFSRTAGLAVLFIAVAVKGIFYGHKMINPYNYYGKDRDSVGSFYHGHTGNGSSSYHDIDSDIGFD